MIGEGNYFMGGVNSGSSLSGEQLTLMCEKIISGNRVAENEFVSFHYKWLLFIVRKKFNGTDLHLDIVQDAFVLVISKIKNKQVEQHHTIRAYLRTCAINIGFEYIRKDKKYVSSVDQDHLELFEDGSKDIISQLEWNEGIEYVKIIMQQLPTSRDRKILTQFYFDDLDKDQICKNLKLSSTHFDRVIYRAKQRLIAKISNDGGSNGDYSSQSRKFKRDKTKNMYNKKPNGVISRMVAVVICRMNFFLNYGFKR